MADSEGIRYHDETTIRVACGNEGFNLVHVVVNGCDVCLHAEGRGGVP